LLWKLFRPKKCHKKSDADRVFWLQSNYFSMLYALDADCVWWSLLKDTKNCFVAYFQKRRHKCLTKQWFLYQDSAQTHTTKAAVLSLAYACGTPVKHPASCPDLTHCDASLWALKVEIGLWQVVQAATAALCIMRENSLQHCVWEVGGALQKYGVTCNSELCQSIRCLRYRTVWTVWLLFKHSF